MQFTSCDWHRPMILPGQLVLVWDREGGRKVSAQTHGLPNRQCPAGINPAATTGKGDP
jgi:hypothetical protein